MNNRIIPLFLVAWMMADAIPVAAEEYRILSAGEEKIFRVVEEMGVVEIVAGRESGTVLKMEPRIFLRAGRFSDVPALATRTGATGWGQSGIGLNHWLDFPSIERALAAVALLQSMDLEVSPSIGRQMQSRFQPSDPLFKDQWHLRNRGKSGGTKGIDLNISEAWKTRRGKGVFIAVIDDGLEINHPDLAANCFTVASGMHRDFNDSDGNPSPSRQDAHGTCVASVLASPSNSVGGIGVAPEAKLAGLRLTADLSTGEMEAKAFAWKNQRIAIYNNSWGPPDEGWIVQSPDAIARDAILAAVKFGRGGRGNIFVWAGGNGFLAGDDSNYDGYANLPQTIAVGAVSDQGRRTTEGEPGANLVVVAPASSFGRQGIVCADLVGARGFNVDGRNDGLVFQTRNFKDLNYTNDFGMTSGAAPQVSGVVSLMLEANPNLGWRDVQEILITTARRVSAADRGWKKNGAGLFFNHQFGAGLVDASAAVRKAGKWKNLSAATKVTENTGPLDLAIPDNNSSGATLDFDFSNSAVHPNLRVEHVQFSVSLRHEYRGDLKFVLTSPSGMKSEVGSRWGDDGKALNKWNFMSVRHWGESSAGKWQLKVIDTIRGDTGKITFASVTLHGTRRSR